MSSPREGIALTPQVSPRTQPLMGYSSDSLSPDTTWTSASSSKQPVANTMIDSEIIGTKVASTEPWLEEIAAQLDEPPCTTTTLQNFSRVRQRNKQRKGTKDDDPWIEEDQKVAPLLQKLRAWRDSKNREISRLFTSRRQTRPRDDELEKLALHYFPARGDLRVRIIDFGNGWAKMHEARTLGEVVNCEELFPSTKGFG
jgi:hypothetical protein